MFKLLFDKLDSKLEELLFLLSIIVVSLLFNLDLFILEIKELDILLNKELDFVEEELILEDDKDKYKTFFYFCYCLFFFFFICSLTKRILILLDLTNLCILLVKA